MTAQMQVQSAHDHTAHIFTLGGPLILLGGMLLALYLTRPGRPQQDAPTKWALAALTAAWIGSTVIHIAVISEHFQESAILGLFFSAVSVLQLAYVCRVLVCPTRGNLVLGIAINLTLLSLWAYTRLVSVPFGLGGRERVGLADLCACYLEEAAILIATMLLVHLRRSEREDSSLRGISSTRYAL